MCGHEAGHASNGAADRQPLMSEVLRRRARFAVIVALANLTAFNAYQIVSYAIYRRSTQWPDFLYFYSFAKVGLTSGFTHLYDPIAQAVIVHSIEPNAPFYEVVNPPPFAWVLEPLAVLPYPLALGIWTALMVGAATLTWYLLGAGEARLIFALMWLGFLAAYIVVVSAPMAPLLMLTLAATWKLMRNQREIAAGLVLSIGLLKPNLVSLVPIALLAAGHRRVFIGWLAAALVMVTASVLSLGTRTADYFTESVALAGNGYALRWSLVPIVGDGNRWLAAAILVAGATLLIAWRVRRTGPGPVLAVGIAGSLLVNHHMTPGDLNLLLVPIWLLLLMPGGFFWKTTVGVLWTGAWFGLIFPLMAVGVLVAIPVVVFIRVSPWAPWNRGPYPLSLHFVV